MAKHVFGINTLDGQKSLDNDFTHYIINVMAEDAMNKDDYQFVRLTDDYDKDIVKRQKVLDYLNFVSRKR